MRVKTVPNEMPKPSGEGKSIFDNKWVLYGSIAAGAVFIGYIFLSSNAANAQGLTPGSSGNPVDYTAATPLVVGSAGSNPNNGAGGSSGGTSSSDLISAINAELQNATLQQETQLAQIGAQERIATAANQTAVQTAEISAAVSNFANGSNVISQFLSKSPSNLTGLAGVVLPTNNGGVDVNLLGYNTGGKNTVAANLTGSSVFQSVAQGAIQNTASINAGQNR